jgi:hypothetical protein
MRAWPFIVLGVLFLLAGVYLALTYKSPIYAIEAVLLVAALALAVVLARRWGGGGRARCRCCATCACTCGKCGCRKASGAEAYVHMPTP